MINITIEPTDTCNGKCFYCIVGSGQPPHPQRGGLLPLGIHNKLFRDLYIFIKEFSCAPTSDKNIYLRYCGVGEPTLHPDFMVMFNKGLNFPLVKQLAILSNGSRWEKEMVDNFIKICRCEPTKPIELIFSLDTLRPQTQFKIKKLSNIEEIIKQLIYLLDQKVENQLNNLHLIFQMIVLEENINEIAEFCNFWTDAIIKRGMSLKIVCKPDYAKYFLENDCFIWLKCCESDENNQKRFSDLYHCALKQIGIPFSDGKFSFQSSKIEEPATNPFQECTKYHHVCSMLWYGIVISADGSVSPCCSDINFELKIGNLKENSIMEIYRGKIMQDLRLCHIYGSLQSHPICRDCNILYRGTPVLDNDVIEYLTVTGIKT